MPFRSQAQRGWMWANRPEMATRWQAETPKGAKLPAHVGTLARQRLLAKMKG